MMRRIFKHGVTIILIFGFAVLALGSMASSPQSKQKIMEYKKVSSLKELDKTVLYSEGKGYIVEAYIEYVDVGGDPYGINLIDRDNGIKTGPFKNFHENYYCRYHNDYSHQHVEKYYYSHWADASKQFRPRIDINKKYTVYIGVYNAGPKNEITESGNIIRVDDIQPYIDRIEGLETIAEIEARRKVDDEAFGKAGTPNKQEDFDVRQNAQGGITITGYKGTRRWVIIPDTLYGQKVTEIGTGVFSGKNLTNIIIPNTVTHIRFRAFTDNSQLTELVLPDALIEIEDSVFLDCGLSNLRLGNRIQKIGMAAFGRNNISTLVITSATTNYEAQSLFGQFITTPFEDNPLIRVTLPANMSDNNVRIINSDLGSYYISQGKKAGTYVKNGPVWNRE